MKTLSYEIGRFCCSLWLAVTGKRNTAATLSTESMMSVADVNLDSIDPEASKYHR
jgi:hypothetical protein